MSRRPESRAWTLERDLLDTNLVALLTWRANVTGAGSAPPVRPPNCAGPLHLSESAGVLDVSRGRRACRRDSKKFEHVEKIFSKVGILNLKTFGFGSRGDEGDAVTPVRKSTCIVGSDGQISGRPQQEEKGENGAGLKVT